MKYLKKFKTNAEYQTYITDKTALKPNVSYVTDDSDVFYNPYIPTDYSKLPLTMEIVEGGDVVFNFTKQYESVLKWSSDEGETWNSVAVTRGDHNIGTFSAGDNIMVECTLNNLFMFNNTTAKFNLSGNIMSLWFSDDFADKTNINTIYSGKYNSRVFNSLTNLLSAENLVLPATTLKDNCYEGMFMNCTSLTKAPKILPATTLTNRCYLEMFKGCTSLVTAPELPATTLAVSCYQSMFSGCTSLTTAPELPATTYSSTCYQYMFYDCTSLNYAKMMLLSGVSEGGATKFWMYNVSATGTFVKNANATWTTTGAHGIPSGWTVETATE